MKQMEKMKRTKIEDINKLINLSICPLDYTTNGVIVDDTINNILVKRLPSGCRLTGLVDACHSGSVFDLPYVFDGSTGYGKTGMTQENSLSKGSYGDVILLRYKRKKKIFFLPIFFFFFKNIKWVSRQSNSK
jgi:hypothetical protein